ncbi:MAG: site-specific recombinase [Comamonadaceae bacterium]|nr:site-specific recombinase [Comamonadaceae bacterium]
MRPRRREGAEAAAARYDAMLTRLEADPGAGGAARGSALHADDARPRRLVGFFADSGILPATGFFSELGRIVAQRLLPELPDEGEIARPCCTGLPSARRLGLAADAAARTGASASGASSAVDRRRWRRCSTRCSTRCWRRCWCSPIASAASASRSEFGRLGAEFAGYAPRFRGLAARRAALRRRAIAPRLMDPQRASSRTRPNCW